MSSTAIKSLAICVIGAAAIAGCASSPSSPQVASAQRNVQSGKVTAVESAALVEQTEAETSSGNSAVVTRASGGPSVVTVLFNDGQESKYVIENPAARHTVGEPVYVITDGEQTTIVPR